MGILNVALQVLFTASLATGKKCSAKCGTYAVITVDGKEVCKSKEGVSIPEVHVTVNLNCKTGEIPNNARVSVHVWGTDEHNARALMDEWLIPPSDFDVGNKLFVGEIARKIRGVDQRNLLYGNVRWTPTKQLGRCLLINSNILDYLLNII